ncbi:MAG: hypothetical protein HYV03_07740 [Deltaproteobacteria bacterium]|nr:hypothetical protein [Deltaproteobacteria bacterium]
MRTMVRACGIIVAMAVATACGPKLTKDTYIEVMSALGCKLLNETDPGAAEVYKKFGVTQADVNAFRRGTKREVMMEVATAIGQNVAKCHGAGGQ